MPLLTRAAELGLPEVAKFDSLEALQRSSHADHLKEMQTPFVVQNFSLAEVLMLCSIV